MTRAAGAEVQDCSVPVPCGRQEGTEAVRQALGWPHSWPMAESGPKLSHKGTHTKGDCFSWYTMLASCGFLG